MSAEVQHCPRLAMSTSPFTRISKIISHSRQLKELGLKQTFLHQNINSESLPPHNYQSNKKPQWHVHFLILTYNYSKLNRILSADFLTVLDLSLIYRNLSDLLRWTFLSVQKQAYPVFHLNNQLAALCVFSGVERKVCQCKADFRTSNIYSVFGGTRHRAYTQQCPTWS